MSAKNSTKAQLVAKLEANDALKAQAVRGAKSDDYIRLIKEALDSTASTSLKDKMFTDCGTRNKWNNVQNCGSPYCVRCFRNIVANQKDDMALAMKRHGMITSDRVLSQFNSPDT